ncbi:hypothetical protein DFH08DRAFT_941625 [Mycena albidolilacea]|uniref:Uncharacterized protein n=1 Tax=Mycena albidolilacea TaxID=1033008 RepID=A0AAD6ZHL7_9AGAR|nr:hypothetical protein DFH08DRAFT_941625 [Mycena albidolilacea]
MPTKSHRINFTSPLVQYLDGQWSVPVSSSPNQSPSVSCHAKHGNRTTNSDENSDGKCSASLQFIGKNITLSLVDIHCEGDDNNNNSCTTMLDGSPQTAPPDNICELGIDEGPHNFSLTAKNIDLGYFNLSSTVASMNDLRVQDDALAFVYEPQDSWRNMISSPGFDGGNVHTTTRPNANVTFSFKGDRVALYGSVGPQGGGYTAQLDNRPTLEIAASLPLLSRTSFSELIFFTAGLDSDAGEHSVTLVSTSPGGFTVDYAVVDAEMNSNLSASSSSTTSPGASNTASTTPTNSTPPPFAANSASQHSSGLSGARLIGLIAGVAVLLALLLIALGYIVCLRRRRNRREEETPRSFDDFPPPHPTGATPAPTEYTQTSQQPLFLVPQPQPQRTSWDARSFDSRSSATLDESSEGYQAEVYAKDKFNSYARGSLPVGYGKNRSSNVGLNTSQETGLAYAV